MRIAITGHTSGIGKAIADRMALDGHEIVGFSRSNGFNIEEPDPIVAAVGDCDIFVNNAHSGYHQVALLYRVHDTWKMKKNRLILNVGSYGAENLSAPYEYGTQKAALEHACRQLDDTNGCRVALLRLGYTATPRNKHHIVRKMPVEWVGDAVHWMLTQPKSVFVRDFTAIPR